MTVPSKALSKRKYSERRCLVLVVILRISGTTRPPFGDLLSGIFSEIQLIALAFSLVIALTAILSSLLTNIEDCKLLAY